MMDSVLETVCLDIEDIVGELKSYYEETGQAEFNSTALTKTKIQGDNLMCCCPYQEENRPSFGLLMHYPYTWQCFGCGRAGTLPQLVAHCCGFKNEVVGEHFLLKNFATLTADKRPKLDLEAILDKKILDRKCSHLEEEIAQYIGKRHPYMYSRGFADVVLDKYEVGFDEDTQSMVIPVRASDGGIRFVKRRFVFKKGFLNEKNIDKRDIVYGLYYIIQADKDIHEIALNESETDTIACYQGGIPAGAVLGRLLFKEQIHELMKADIKVVNLFFDNDYWGVKATLQAYKMLTESSPIRVNIIKYPCARFGFDTMSTDEIPYKDANDLLKAGLLKRIEKITYEEYVKEISKELLKDNL